MEESVIYQDILERGLERGQQRERSLILRQLTLRVGELPGALLQRLNTLSIEQLENLGEALLDFGSVVDLEVWFEALE